MTNKLTVHTATLHTATIEVKTLTLSAKQVTLSVFRQLQEEDIQEANGSTRLRGVGWGWVHYCPGKGQCSLGRVGRHRHLVWQLGEELRRCPFLLTPLAQGANAIRFPDLHKDLIALDDLPQLFVAI